MSEVLDFNKIDSCLSPESKKFVQKIDIFQSINSTNTYLLEQIKKGILSGSVCFAESQTAGRGRQGKTWLSVPHQSLCFSIAWKFANEVQLTGLSVAVGVMIIKALIKYGINKNLQLKWPNDVLFEGRKLAGILLEGIHHSIVIGVGLNVCLPVDSHPSWTSLDKIVNEKIQRNRLAGLLVDELISSLQIFQIEGVTPFIHEWKQYDFLMQKEVMISTQRNNFKGIAQGVNDQGELIIKNEKGELQTLNYGEVSCAPLMKDFHHLITKARTEAKKVGLKKQGLQKIIKKVRKEKEA